MEFHVDAWFDNVFAGDAPSLDAFDGAEFDGAEFECRIAGNATVPGVALTTDAAGPLSIALPSLQVWPR